MIGGFIMGAPLTTGVVFSTNLTVDPKDLEFLKRELQNMQISADIELHPTLEYLKNKPQKGDRDPDTGGYIPPTEQFIFISVMYEMLISNPGVLDLILFTVKQLIAKILSGEGSINFGDIHIELKLSFLSNININVGKEIVISNSTSNDQSVVVLQDEFKRLKKRSGRFKKAKR